LLLSSPALGGDEQAATPKATAEIEVTQMATVRMGGTFQGLADELLRRFSMGDAGEPFDVPCSG
jgi:hypothetical protein